MHFDFKVCRSISSFLLLSVLFLWIVSYIHCVLYVLLLPGLYLRAYDSQCAQIYQIIKCTIIFKINSVMIDVGHRPPCSIRYQHWLLFQLVVLDPIYVHCIDKSSLNILQIIFCVPQEENKSGFHFWMPLSFQCLLDYIGLRDWVQLFILITLNLQFHIKRAFLHRNNCTKGASVLVILKTRDADGAQLNKQIRTTAGRDCGAFEVYWIPGSPLMCRLWTQFQSVLHKWLFGERYFREQLER